MDMYGEVCFQAHRVNGLDVEEQQPYLLHEVLENYMYMENIWSRC